MLVLAMIFAVLGGVFIGFMVGWELCLLKHFKPEEVEEYFYDKEDDVWH